MWLLTVHWLSLDMSAGIKHEDGCLSMAGKWFVSRTSCSLFTPVLLFDKAGGLTGNKSWATEAQISWLLALSAAGMSSRLDFWWETWWWRSRTPARIIKVEFICESYVQQIIFSAMGKSLWLFVEGTRVMLPLWLAYKTTAAIYWMG